jgi:hypothetical protein
MDAPYRYRGKLEKVYISGGVGDIDLQDPTADTEYQVLGKISYRQFIQTLNRREKDLCKKLMTQKRNEVAKAKPYIVQALQRKALQFFGCKPSPQIGKILI